MYNFNNDYPRQANILMCYGVIEPEHEKSAITEIPAKIDYIQTITSQHIIEPELIELNNLIKKKKEPADEIFVINKKNFNNKIQELCDKLMI